MANFKVTLTVERIGDSLTPGSSWSMTFQDLHPDGDNPRYDVASISEGIYAVTRQLNSAVTALTSGSQLGTVKVLS